MPYVFRVIPIEAELKKKSVLLLGPRRTGKSALIRNQVESKTVYNLLESDTFQKLSARPGLIRESIVAAHQLIVIDEIQKLPTLMDEVHLMIEEYGTRFFLTGSSARKLRRSHTSLMAGRAKTLRLLAFCSREIPEYDLDKRLLYGSLPPVVLSDDPWDEISTYTGDYLREEVQAEALSRNIEGFSRFLLQAAIANGQILNFESIGSDAQVPARTIREYYSILTDTLIGSLVEPLPPKKAKSRKAVTKAKFYFFDTGVPHAITGTRMLPKASDLYGRSFEHFIFQELLTYQQYFKAGEPINFWANHGGGEVDFVLSKEIAIEVKATELVQEKHLKNLIAISEDYPIKRRIVVSRDSNKRMVSGIQIVPYREFLRLLWAGGVW